MPTLILAITKLSPKGMTAQAIKASVIVTIGAKIKILDSGTVVYDKTPLKGQKTGFVKASFKGLGSTGKGLKGYGAKLKKKAGRGFNIEF